MSRQARPTTIHFSAYIIVAEIFVGHSFLYIYIYIDTLSKLQKKNNTYWQYIDRVLFSIFHIRSMYIVNIWPIYDPSNYEKCELF